MSYASVVCVSLSPQSTEDVVERAQRELGKYWQQLSGQSALIVRLLVALLLFVLLAYMLRGGRTATAADDGAPLPVTGGDLGQ